MAALPAIVILFLCFFFSQGSKLIDGDKNQIIWPTEYHLQGEMLNFKTSIVAPIEIWYNHELQRGRFDLYDGTDKKYYYGDKSRVYTVVPMPTKTHRSEMKCFKWKSSRQINLLPDTKHFQDTGKTEYLFDKEVDVWTYSQVINDTQVIVKQTLYVYRTDEGYDLPVQYIFKTYRKRGGVVTHSVYKYYNFEANASKNDLRIRNMTKRKCKYMGNLGDNWKTDHKFLHPDIPGDVDRAFRSYTSHHKKDYNEHEALMRKSIFEKNWRMVEEHNRKNLSYKMEINALSDKTLEELSNLRSFSSKDRFPVLQEFPLSSGDILDEIQELPTNFDLRLEGVIGPIRDQGICGACWAFTTTAIVETALARSNGGRLLDLSEQSIIDCGWGSHNSGCYGGVFKDALKYVLEHGIATEEEYGTYNEKEGYCHNVTNTYKIKGFVKVPPRSVDALKLAVFKYGAVGVSVLTSQQFSQYSTGVFYDTECDYVSRHPKTSRRKKLGQHAVAVVGYGVRDGEEYWVVRNSWGQEWGQGGYILWSAKYNNCFLMNRPFYAIV